MFTLIVCSYVIIVNMTDLTTPAEGAARSTPYHHGDLRRTLVTVARQLLEQQGLAAVTVRAACQAAGVSPGAPYRHFRSRDDLLAAVATQAFEELRDCTQAARDAQAEPGAALVAVGAAYIQFAHRHANSYRLMFGGGLDKQAHPDLQTAGRLALGVLQQAVTAWRAQSLQPAELDDTQLAVLAWSLAHGVSTLSLDGLLDMEPSQTQALAEQLFRRVVAALAG